MIALLTAFSALAAETLDTDMSPQDRKNTGLYKLTDKEKAALQKWIDAHYEPKSAPEKAAQKPVDGSHPTLSENLLNSRYLRLSDGTLWNVRPEDVPIAQGWIMPVEIIVGKSSNPFYPFRLTNKVSGSSVLVRKAEKLPEPGSPPLAPNSGEKTF